MRQFSLMTASAQERGPSLIMRRRVLLLSPIVVIGAGHVTARACGSSDGHWRWIPVILVLWLCMSAFSWLLTDWSERQQWYRPSQGALRWRVLAMLVGLIPLPLLLIHGKLLSSPYIWIPWLIFGVINPFVEETYWRGALSVGTSQWPAWLSVVYTSAVFAFSHPLVLGVFSLANRSPEVIVSTFVMGVVWAVVYRKTRSLRWPIASHLLVDLLNVSVPAFLNMYVPGQRS